MAGDIQFGDSVTQIGDNNIGMMKSQQPVDERGALRDMVAAARSLREHVEPEDRRAIDDALDSVGSGQDVRKATWRRALRDISGIASLVGQVGVPAVESARRLAEALGL